MRGKAGQNFRRGPDVGTAPNTAALRGKAGQNFRRGPDVGTALNTAALRGKASMPPENSQKENDDDSFPGFALRRACASRACASRTCMQPLQPPPEP